MSGESVHAGAARVVRRRRFNPIWLVPLLTVALAGWLVWQTLSRRGPMITITFQSAGGLTAGQSQIRYKDIVMGTVQEIRLADDLSHVIVSARINPEAAHLLTARTQFWVVKPRLFAGNISGLETVLSGSYIALLPSPQAASEQHAFTGLEEPPVLQSTEPGRTFLLKSDRLGSIQPGSPIFYRGFNVGQVLGYDLKDQAREVVIHAFVRAPFDGYVHEATRFWNASGATLKMGSEGIRFEVESLRAVLLGGIAFDNADDAPADLMVGPVPKEFEFTLFGDHEDAIQSGYRRKVKAVAYFDGSLAGLAKGAPVSLRGIRIGEVTGVRLEYDAATDSIRAPVDFLIEPERIGEVSNETANLKRGPVGNMQRLVDLGLRAQLQSVNLLTGQKGIEFAHVTGAAPATVKVVDGVLVVPTAPAGLAGIMDSVNALLTRVSQMPFDQIGNNLNGLLQGIDRTVNGADTKAAIASVQTMMKAAADVMRNLDTGTAPVLKKLPELSASIQSAVTNVNKVLTSVDRGYGDNSKMYRNLDRLLVELNDTAMAVRVLSDTLTRHPEALIRGRPPGSQP